MNELTDRNHKPAPILSRYAALLLCAIWLLTGVVGHEPWKPEDALHLGVAFGMSSGDWLVPRIAGDPWLVSPPLYHWVAALCGRLFGWLLPWHDAARLASTLFAASFLLILWRFALRQMRRGDEGLELHCAGRQRRGRPRDDDAVHLMVAACHRGVEHRHQRARDQHRLGPRVLEKIGVVVGGQSPRAALQ